MSRDIEFEGGWRKHAEEAYQRLQVKEADEAYERKLSRILQKRQAAGLSMFCDSFIEVAADWGDGIGTLLCMQLFGHSGAHSTLNTNPSGQQCCLRWDEPASV